MLTALWTATVRAIAVLTAVLAVGLIIVSLQAARAQAGPPDGEAGPPTQSSDIPDEAQPLQPVRATTQTPPGPTASARMSCSPSASPVAGMEQRYGSQLLRARSIPSM